MAGSRCSVLDSQGVSVLDISLAHEDLPDVLLSVPGDPGADTSLEPRLGSYFIYHQSYGPLVVLVNILMHFTKH